MTQIKETSPIQLISAPVTLLRFYTVIYRAITVDMVCQSITDYFYRVTKTPAREEPFGTNSNPGQHNHITEGSNFLENII